MKSLYLLLLVTQSFALLFTSPTYFGGETDFSDRAWRELIDQLSPEVRVGKPPTIELNIAEEPTCRQYITSCSTSYFGKDLALTQPESAQVWIKWHQDATPFVCKKPEGCIVTSASAVANLTSQSNGWGVTASINALYRTRMDRPPISGAASAVLSYRYSEAQISPKIMTSTKTLTSRCFQDHMCYMQTGTLMMNIDGKCDSKPVIVCDQRYFPCELYARPWARACSQWADFTLKYCNLGVSESNIEDCSLTVAVTRDNGLPMSYQMFEQKPISGMSYMAKRDYMEPDSPFGELPDGSSGAWMEWTP